MDTQAIGRPPTDAAIVADIWRRLAAGERPDAIAGVTGVSASTVYRERKAWLAVQREKAGSPAKESGHEADTPKGSSIMDGSEGRNVARSDADPQEAA